MLNVRNKPYLGYQNKTDVAIQLYKSIEPLQSSLALQEHMGCRKGYVSK